MKTELITTAALINKEIASIKTAGAKLDQRIQVAGLSVLNHVDLHGDVTVVNGLFLAMPKGSRRKAMAEWLVAHGKVIPNPDKAAQATVPFCYDKTKETRLDVAETMPWWEFAPEKAPLDVFDFNAMLAQLIKKAEKAEQSGIKIEGAEALTKIRALAAAK